MGSTALHSQGNQYAVGDILSPGTACDFWNDFTGCQKTAIAIPVILSERFSWFQVTHFFHDVLATEIGIPECKISLEGFGADTMTEHIFYRYELRRYFVVEFIVRKELSDFIIQGK